MLNMTDVKQAIKKSVGKKAAHKSVKSDKTLLKDAKERIMRLQKKAKKTGKKDGKKNGKKNAKTAGERKIKKRGVVYLGHLPHGFYEEELRGFFSQFGKVSRVKVSRSSRTGKSKGYAFVEFAFNDVAKIVAETMNNYLMFERLVKAQYIPPAKVNDNMFPVRWITPKSYPTLVRRNQLKAKQEKPANEEDKMKHRKRTEFKINRAVGALKEMGIDYYPQIYDPEADKYANESTNKEEVDTDEVPQLVSIQPTAVENTPSKQQGKAAKKNAGKAVVKPIQDSPAATLVTENSTTSKQSSKPQKNTPAKVEATVESTANVSILQDEKSTPSKKSSKQKKKTPAKVDNKRVSDSAVTDSAPETPVKRLKPSAKDAKVASTTPEMNLKTPKGSAKVSSIPTKVVVKSSPSSDQASVKSSPSPAKASKKAAKPSLIPKPSAKASAPTSPKPSPKPDSKKTKRMSLIKEVAAPSKVATRSAKGKKSV